MKFTYIYHSCLVIGTNVCNVLIDYYKDSDNAYIHNRLLQDEKPLYVLSSHAHADHFNPEILTWRNDKSNIIYVLSSDIAQENIRKGEVGNIYFLNKGEVYNDALIHIKAFGSTDIGISFLINIEGKTVFHAGDLNNWHWKDESTPEEAIAAEEYFLKELEQIALEVLQIDATAFPVDPRMGSDYMRGAQQFVSRLQTSYFMPIHFGEAYEKANAFGPYAKKSGVHFMALTQQEQSFEL